MIREFIHSVLWQISGITNVLPYPGAGQWYALTEVNWYNWTRSGDNTALPGVEGGDLFNFGSVGVAGNDIVTQALGVKFKRNRHNELGTAFEVPLTKRRDILESRFTLDWILRY